MDTVVVTRTFEGDIDALVAYCRTLDSRAHFPGANLEGETPGKLHFAVGMRLKAATMTDLFINETLGDVNVLEGGVVQFDTTSWANWPDGQSGATSEFVFTPPADGAPGTLRLTYNYTAPGKSLVKVKALPAFHVAMEKVIGRYVEGMIAGAGAKPGLAAPMSLAEERDSAAASAASAATNAAGAVASSAAGAMRSMASSLASAVPSRSSGDTGPIPGGMDTVCVHRAFDVAVPDMVAHCRTLGSRINWPGSQLEWEKEDTLYYGVGMRLSAATMTDITVEERLGEVEDLETGQTRFTTTQRITWPQGHGDAITEYLFTPGSGDNPNDLRFTYTYAPPSTKLVKTKELAAFKGAMEKVAGRYLHNLSDSVVRA